MPRITPEQLRLRKKAPVLVFDGDDTLWFTMPLYRRAKEQFFMIMQLQGFDRGSVEEFFENLDAKNVRRLGFSGRRFSVSMLATYRTFCNNTGRRTDRAVEIKIRRTASQVFDRKPLLAPFATQTLNRLQKRYHLFLLTKGERKVQNKRLDSSGLRRFFRRVIIVPDKNFAVFKLVSKRYKLVPHNTWSIGNSLKSDINPALRAGFSAIWIPYQTWRYEEGVQLRKWKPIKAQSLREV